MNCDNKKELRSALMKILYCSVNETNMDPSFNGELTSEVIKAMYIIAQKHSLSHLLTRYLFENEIELEPDMANALKRASIKTVHKHELMKLSLKEICATFENEKIDHILLKGAVIREYYPEDDMRTSCDIDVLIREADLDRAIEVLKKKGFTGGERHYHDVSLYSPNGTHLELHFKIQEYMDNLDAVLKDAWEYATPISESRYEFSKDFFVFYIFAHMAYHFLSGGCGIRSLMDVWVMKHRMNVDYTCALPLLQRAGIDIFAREMSNIAERCFTECDDSDPLLDYIWRGGTYGSRQNKFAAQSKTSENAFAHVISVIFMPYKDMTISYVFLKKAPVLLPFCWVHRWLKALKNGRAGRLSSDVNSIKQVQDKDIMEAQEIRDRLGI